MLFIYFRKQSDFRPRCFFSLLFFDFSSKMFFLFIFYSLVKKLPKFLLPCVIKTIFSITNKVNIFLESV